MDFALGLMMTAVGLCQEAESPLGHVATLDPEGQIGDEGGKSAADGQQQGQRVSEAIATAFKRLEATEARRAGQRVSLYETMRQTAAKFEGQRQGGGTP